MVAFVWAYVSAPVAADSHANIAPSYGGSYDRALPRDSGSRACLYAIIAWRRHTMGHRVGRGAQQSDTCTPHVYELGSCAIGVLGVAMERIMQCRGTGLHIS